ncbi:MAG TPA: glycosyltransferase family 2 protein [Polyangia bacterium]|nr:glycosyltransferase family 2 protein [Polyangia bacterium]
MRLDVIMPVFNETGTLREIAARVLAQSQVARLIAVDDGSADSTAAVLDELARADGRVLVLSHPVNRGKGAAIRTGLAHVEADAVVIQDADLEYDPDQYGALLAPLEAGEADVVFGSRYVGGAMPDGQAMTAYLANRLLTFVSNRLTGLRLTDMETCYKCFSREVARGLELTEDRFGIEPEIAALIAQVGFRVREVPIRYRGRNRSSGKKIGPRDGVDALKVMIRCWWRCRRGCKPG